VVVVDAAIFTAFGAAVLRRRLVGPLERLAGAARELAAGASGVRAQVEGTRETAALGRAFNEMTDALEGRSEALRKAVVELRNANEELRRARAGLERADRLAAVGRLAAGVAHEVGNPIGAILAFADLAARDPGISEASRGHLQRAGQEGERVRTILRQLLDFSRPPQASPVPLDLSSVAAQAVALMEAQPRYQHIRFDVEKGDPALRARGDESAVSQILLNLLLNAADAVSGRPEARVRVQVGACALRVRRGEEGAHAATRRRADGVECVVSDNGSGVDPEDRERIFDPFFTTKPPGEGTGLGLANACRLAEEIDGRVELVDPPPGFRTALVLRLPAVHGPVGRVREDP
jgi:two-component system, NtrC family, sensor kinase